MSSDVNYDVPYVPLPSSVVNSSEEIGSEENATQFSKATIFSTITFWWLNPLMKKGKEQILQDEDIPLLRHEDRAKNCYIAYAEHLRKRKHTGSSKSSFMLSAIISLHWKQIVISGLFALIKVLTTSLSPLFLKAFIDVAEGNQRFEFESHILTGGLFLTKCLESLSERQWYFRTRLIGMQVRSMLSAAIYQKQLRLSNAVDTGYSPGEIVNLVTSDAYRIGEFPYWFHQIWTTSFQLCVSLVVVYYTIGVATIAALITIVLIVILSSPLIKSQLKYHKLLMEAQDKRLRTISEALANMKVLKLYAWEMHFMNVIERLRNEEIRWILGVLLQRAYQLILFWSCPILVPAVTFWTCYLLEFPLSAGRVFTFLASLRIVQEPVRFIPEVIGTFIEAKVSFNRIVTFLEAPELQNRTIRQNSSIKEPDQSIFINSTDISWETGPLAKATLRNINLVVRSGEKVAICGEVGSGKSTLLAAVLGEVPNINGAVHVNGKIAYVSQAAWIQTGTIQENILFGSAMDKIRYNKVLKSCSLVRDLEDLPFGDMTQIGERGVNLSGGQKQRLQLARALYQDADIYLLDDPLSAVDAHTATNLFNEYVIEALAEKTVLLVTHQVDFLPSFNSILLMSAGEIIRAASYDELLASSQEFQHLVYSHLTVTNPDGQFQQASSKVTKDRKEEIHGIDVGGELNEQTGDQLIQKEEKEAGDTGFKPYIQYMKHNKCFMYFLIGTTLHIIIVLAQLIQNYWLAAKIEDFSTSMMSIFAVYSAIGCILAIIVSLRAFSIVLLGLGASRSMFSILLASLFRAPMSFYDLTPLGRILSRVSFDLSVIDTEMPFRMAITIGSTINSYFNFALLAFLTWPVLFIIIPMVYLTIVLQKYYFASTKELMRINGTTKSTIASHLSESIAGIMTIRAFKQEDRFYSKNLELIDRNASAYFHYFSASEWLIQRLELLCAIVLSSTTLSMSLHKFGASTSGFIGMQLSYGLSLNVFLVLSIQLQCLLENQIISVERLEQYMHIPSEAPQVVESNRPNSSWPDIGKVEVCDLKVRYRPNAPLVLQGISFTIEGGHKIGIVGRTGSGKTTLISALFRLVEPTEGRIVIDGLDIAKIGLHDLRSHLSIIPQDPTLFVGSVRYNLDPLLEHTDHEIWEVLEKCHLRAAIDIKEEGLNTLVARDGSNWSMGQRQLFCLGRALLKRSKILLLDEATASIDNATDSFIQKTIRTEFAECTVITVAHRIPTVMDCTMVLAMSSGKVVEYDEPTKLMSNEASLFKQLVNEYYSRTANNNHAQDLE